MMNCQQATQLLSESQDRKLSLKERAQLKVHTAICSGCRNFAHQMNTLRTMARKFIQASDDDHDKPK